MTDQWQFFDDDFIDDARQSKGQGDPFATWLKQDTPMPVWFLTNPFGPNRDRNDWVNFRELSIRDGLRSGYEMPEHLPNWVMVQDFEVISDPRTGRTEYRIDHDLDPLTAGRAGRQMWNASERGIDPNTGLLKPRWRTAVNVVNAATGFHNILVVGTAARKSLKDWFQAANEANPSFDITARPFKLLYTGKGYEWKVAVNVIKETDEWPISPTESVVFPSNAELPEPIDLHQWLTSKRQMVDAFLASLSTGSGVPMNTTVDQGPMPEWAREPEPQWGQTEVEGNVQKGGLDVFAHEEKPTSETELDEAAKRYLEMSPARLRTTLSRLGHPAPRGASHEDLAVLMSRFSPS